MKLARKFCSPAVVTLLFPAQSGDRGPGARALRALLQGAAHPQYGLVHPSSFSRMVIVGASNAVNLTDGLDGLAAGCTITAALAYAVLAYVGGQRQDRRPTSRFRSIRSPAS